MNRIKPIFLNFIFLIASNLPAQSNFFSQQANQRILNLQNQQRNLITLSEATIRGTRRAKGLSALDGVVGPMPDLVPGHVIWQVTGLEPSGIEPVISGNLIIVTTTNAVRCFDIDNGTEKWSLRLQEPPVMQTTMAGGHLWVGVESGHLMSIDPLTGRMLWTRQLKGAKGGKLGKVDIEPMTEPLLSGDRLYLGTFSSGLFKSRGWLYAISPESGKSFWKCEIPGGVTLLPILGKDLVWAVGVEHVGAYRLTDGECMKDYKIDKKLMCLLSKNSSSAFLQSDDKVYQIGLSIAEMKFVPILAASDDATVEDGRMISGAGGICMQEFPSGKESWRSPEKSLFPPFLYKGYVFAATSHREIRIFNSDGGQPVGRLELAADLGFGQPLVHGEKALVCERTATNGVLFEAFKGPSWKRIWRLEVQEAIASLPQFTSKGMLLWTASGYLRLLR
jgi:outer membrane protein assembly factor BamB